MPRALLFLLGSIAAAPGALAQAPNDECPGAILLTNGSHGPFDNFQATTSSPPWTCPGSHDLWFVYHAGGPGTLTISTCGSGLDTVVEAFDGTGGCGALAWIGCNDDGPCGTGSVLSVPVVAGPYWFRVGGFGASFASFGIFTVAVNGPQAGAPVATNTQLGAGCGDGYASVYEPFGTGPADLANTTLTWTRTATGYDVTRTAGTAFLAPTPAASPIAGGQQTFVLPAPLPVPGGSVGVLNVTTAGQVELAAPTSTTIDIQPTIAKLLDWPRPLFACWHWFAPGAGGSVTFEVVGGVAVASWNGVPSSAFGTPPSTFQFQFDLATGDVRLVVVSLNVGGVVLPTQPQCVVGYSPAGPSLDPAATDLSALTSPVPLRDDVPALRLVGSSRPVLGGQWNLVLSALPGTAVLGVAVFGAADPGFDDLSALGLPGCGLRASLDVLQAWVPGGAVHAYGLAVPNVAALVGQRFRTTCAAWTIPAPNAFGAITSNGVEGTLGTL